MCQLSKYYFLTSGLYSFITDILDAMNLFIEENSNIVNQSDRVVLHVLG